MTLYIYVECYTALYFALYLKERGEPITIITINTSIRDFCEFQNLPYRFLTNVEVTLRKPGSFFSFKRTVKKFLAGLDARQGDMLLLLDNSFALSGFYLAALWKRIGTVYYYGLIEFDKSFDPDLGTYHWFVTHAKKNLFKILLRLPITFLDINSKPVIGIGDQFFKLTQSKTFYVTPTLLDVKGEIVSKYKLRGESLDILLVDQGGLDGIVTNESMQNLIRTLFQSPVRTRISIKEHPNFTNPYFPPSSEMRLKRFIPSELYLNSVKTAVLSVYSTSLILASQFNTLKTISLLELVEWCNEDWKKDRKEWLWHESEGKILFPESIDELLFHLQANDPSV